ncbi:hypothetical protein DMP17_12005 [Pseudonocardia sp. TMWB2A]
MTVISYPRHSRESGNPSDAPSVNLPVRRWTPACAGVTTYGVEDASLSPSSFRGGATETYEFEAQRKFLVVVGWGLSADHGGRRTAPPPTPPVNGRGFV